MEKERIRQLARLSLRSLEWAPSVTRFPIGLILLISGMNHLKNPYYFLDSIFAYEIVSAPVGILAASVLPILQTMLGMSLLSGIREEGAWLCSGILLSLFSVAQSIVFGSERLIDCGCFGSEWSVKIGPLSILFVASTAMTCWICFYVSARQQSSSK